MEQLNDVADNKYYSTGQHRGNTGEGQIHLKADNIKEFETYESRARELIENIRTAYKQQKLSSLSR